jgi:hypothetical protein
VSICDIILLALLVFYILDGIRMYRAMSFSPDPRPAGAGPGYATESDVSKEDTHGSEPIQS